MSTTTLNTQAPSAYQRRVDGADWSAIAAEVDDLGGALTPQLLTAADTARLVRLYDRDEAFGPRCTWAGTVSARASTAIWRAPLPEAIEELRHALYPHLLPIAQGWSAKLGRPAPWPDTLDGWLDMCHVAGQTKPTPLILKYGPGDWNALHRHLYGELVFPLQVVINLTEPAVDYTGGEFILVEQRPRAQSRGTRRLARLRARPDIHHP